MKLIIVDTDKISSVNGRKLVGRPTDTPKGFAFPMSCLKEVGSRLKTAQKNLTIVDLEDVVFTEVEEKVETK